MRALEEGRVSLYPQAFHMGRKGIEWHDNIKKPRRLCDKSRGMNGR